MEELKCPHCGSVNVNTDVCDDIYAIDDKVIKEYSGSCMDCGTWLNWDEVFVLKEYSNIRIDS